MLVHSAHSCDFVLSFTKIVAAFRGMHVLPTKHSYASVTDRRTDRQTIDKVIPMCRYAWQGTQFVKNNYVLIDVYQNTCKYALSFTLF